MGNISNCCFNKKKSDVDEQDMLNQKRDNFVFDMSHFKNKKDEKFKDNYKIGQSMGCSHFGEVRKCQHSNSRVVRAVKILRKERIC